MLVEWGKGLGYGVGLKRLPLIGQAKNDPGDGEPCLHTAVRLRKRCSEWIVTCDVRLIMSNVKKQVKHNCHYIHKMMTQGGHLCTRL